MASSRRFFVHAAPPPSRFGRAAVAALTALVITACAAAPAAATEGQYGSDCLPPPDPYTGTFHALYAAGMIDLRNPIHMDFTSCDPPPPPVPGPGTDHTFGSNVRAEISIGGGPFNTVQAPATTRVTVMYCCPGPGGREVFDTEMLQLDITGGTLPPGAMIRESPTRASTGRTTIRPTGGGGYAIDSFFDIFTELSLDGGQTWMPQESPPGHMELTPSVPTPTRAGTWGRLKILYR